jgi:hypothetical protein
MSGPADRYDIGWASLVGTGVGNARPDTGYACPGARYASPPTPPLEGLDRS